MKNWQAFVTFCVIRIASVFVIQTWYVPDEYWQSLEVAHRLTFGYGELTWEWKLGIRSYIYPLLISILYRVLFCFGLDYVHLLILLPRIMQSILTAYADYRFYIWSGHKKWAVFSIGSSYFWFYTGSRTLINTFETAISMIALSYFPWPERKHNNVNNFIWMVGFICGVRPTAAIPWLPLCFYHIITSNESTSRLLVSKYLLIGTVIFLSSTIIDSYAHGAFLISPYEFLKVNLFQGIGETYGSNPWHWYLSNGIPALLGVNFIPFLLASYHILRNRSVFPSEWALLGCMIFTTTIYSYLAHKEFRFILPLLPMALYITTNYLSGWSFKANSIFVWITVSVIGISNLIPAYYIGFVHQRGPLDAMKEVHVIASHSPQNSSFLFLMPCHSTPLYSHIHVNVPIRYLTCLPNLTNISNYKDEADIFYESPSKWLREHYPPTDSLPSHIIAFDVLQESIIDILSRYKPIKQIFHTDMPLSSRTGRNIVIYELHNYNE